MGRNQKTPFSSREDVKYRTDDEASEDQLYAWCRVQPQKHNSHLHLYRHLPGATSRLIVPASY